MTHVTLKLMAAAAAVSILPFTAQAQNYPSKELKIIVPTKAGGSIDRTARSVQKFLPGTIGQTVIVENVAGAGGKIAGRKFLKEPRDGHTLIAHFVPGLTVAAASGAKELGLKDLAVINLQWSDPVIIIANKKTGWKSLEDMITAAKANPGKYSFGSSGKIAAGHVLSERLFNALGLDIKFVPYQGGGKTRAAFKGGHVDMTAGGAGGARRVRDDSVALGLFWPGGVAGWPNAKPLNPQIAKYNASVPDGGAFRFIAVHKDVRDKHPERFTKLVDAVKKAITGAEFAGYAKKTKVGAEWNGPEKSLEILKKIDAGFAKLLKSS